MTVEIRTAPGGCELALTHEGVLPDYAGKTQEGWEMILDGLAGVL